tara:strand:+ start:1086 stop:1313 length:228 start_codon:yes stop_codon:yes gene_type:complete
MGITLLVLDSMMDRVEAALGVEPAASRAGGKEEITVAPMPIVSAFSKLTVSIDISLTESAKYKSLMVWVINPIKP